MSESGSTSEPAVTIPDHELIRPIGRGSYGEVWLARNILGEYRAVKIVRRGSLDRDRAVEREFSGLQKFEPISRAHAGLVQVLHVGRFAQGFYYVMELADDASATAAVKATNPEASSAWDAYTPRTLRSELQHRGQLPIDECLNVSLKLTDALAHLHGHGLVHRDIKPSNIIFVWDQPKLADIGLVALSDASLTCVGTEGYLPPEGPGKPQADLYALGKVFYEISTGRDRNDFPELPTMLRENPDREALEEFNEIILKACHPDVRRRYPDAQAMHADLVLWQAGKSIRRSRALERRLALLTRIAAGVLVVASLSVGAYLYQQLQTREARRLAQDNRQLAFREGTERKRAESLLNTLQLKQAEHFFEDDEPNRGIAFLARMLRQNPSNLLAAARLMSALNDRSFALPLRVIEFPERIEDSVFSADRSRFVGWTWSEAKSNGVARIWDVVTGKELAKPMPLESEATHVKFSPNGRRIAIAMRNRKVQVWDAATGEDVGEPLETGPDIVAIGFSPDSERLLVMADILVVVTPASSVSTPLLKFESGEFVGSSAEFSPDGSRIMTADQEGRIRLWDAATGRHLMELEKFVSPAATALPALFSPNGDQIAATSGTYLVIWDAHSGRLLHLLDHDSQVRQYGFSPDGLRIATGDEQGWVRIWDAQTGQPLMIPIKHNMDVWAVEFDSSGERLFTRERRRGRLWDSRTGQPLGEWISSAWRGGFVQAGQNLLAHEHHNAVVWDIRPGQAPNVVLHHRGVVDNAGFDSTGDKVITVARGWPFNRPDGSKPDSEIALWHSRSGELVIPWLKAPYWMGRPEFSPDGRNFLVPDSGIGLVHILDAATGKPTSEPLRHSNVAIARYSRDGQMIATVEWGSKSLQLWSTASGQPLIGPLTLSTDILTAEFSPDGHRIMVIPRHSGSTTTASIWDVSSGRLLVELASPGHRFMDAQFSPDGKHVVGAFVEYKALIFDSETGQVVGSPLKHENSVWTARYSPDGRWVVTASSDQTARIWDARTGQLVGEPMQHKALVAMARFSPDSRRIVTFAPADRSARIWDVESSRPLTEPFFHEGEVWNGEFSPDGSRVITASADGTARVWELPPVELPVPGWLIDLAEAMAGHRLLDKDMPEDVLAKDFLALKERILASPATDRYTTWAKWFLCDRSERSVSYASTFSVTNHLARLLERNSVPTLREALRYSPNDAEATARLAREVLTQSPREYPHKEQAAAFLTERSVKLKPDEMHAWWAKAEAAAQAGRFDEAIEGLENALRLKPDSQKLWALKGQWLEKQGHDEEALQAYEHAILFTEPARQSNATVSEAAEARTSTLHARADLLKRLGRHEAASAARVEALGIPPRDPGLPSSLIDLSAHYARSLRGGQSTFDPDYPGDNIEALPYGDQVLAGVRFDVRGTIHVGRPLQRVLRGTVEEVQGIRVNLRCQKLHFLHAATWASAEVASGRYVVRYEDGRQLEIPMAFGVNVGGWIGGGELKSGEAARAWVEVNQEAQWTGTHRALYHLSWSNPRPQVRIDTIDFEALAPADGTKNAVLLAAITAQIEPTPVITRQPDSQTVSQGAQAEFRVEAKSELPLAYQWQFNGVDIAGATNATFTIKSALHRNAGSYSVKIQNAIEDSVLVLASEPAHLLVESAGFLFGTLRRQVFTNTPGRSLIFLTTHSRFPDQPDQTDFLRQFEIAPDTAENYGVRLSGFLVPPKAGDYRFYLCADDEAALFLSADDSPEHKVQIAHEPQWNGPRLWTAIARRSKQENVSAPIQLEAGRRYYVEALMKQGTGGDNLAVTWQMPGDPPPEDLAPPIPGTYLAVPTEWIEPAPTTIAAGTNRRESP